MGLPPYHGQPCWICNSERLSFRYENHNGDNRPQASMYLRWSCLDCGTESIGVIYDPDPCNVACGWAFDCGVREAERDAAVAAERERCLDIAYHYDAAEEALQMIESGAPAPREG